LAIGAVEAIGSPQLLVDVPDQTSGSSTSLASL
jgi:hypothetical protein